MILVHHGSKILSLKFAVALNTSILESNCSQTFQARLVCKWQGFTNVEKKTHPLWHAEIHKNMEPMPFPWAKSTHTQYIYIYYIVWPCEISVGFHLFFACDFRIVAGDQLLSVPELPLVVAQVNLEHFSHQKSRWTYHHLHRKVMATKSAMGFPFKKKRPGYQSLCFWGRLP